MYRLDTGRFTGHRMSGPSDQCPTARPGCAWFEGAVDPLRHLVDLADPATLVEYTPAAPDEDHELIEVGGWRRFALKPDAAALREDARQAQYAMDSEERASLRALREGLLELLPAESAAGRRLRELESGFDEKRAKVRAAAR